MLIKQIDMRARAVKKIAALGDSITWGMSASSHNDRWINLVVSMIEYYQKEKVELINQGICGNILTTNSPAYEISAKPSGMERVYADIISNKPDMVFLAYGLNDSRGGTSPDVFRKEYQKLIEMILKEIDATIVVLNTYYMHEEFYKSCEGWNKSSYSITEEFNLIIKQLAEKNDLIYADIYSAQAGVNWIVSDDHCHPNDLGHRIIANKVFEAIVRNCSFLNNNNQ